MAKCQKGSNVLEDHDWLRHEKLRHTEKDEEAGKTI